MIKQNKGFNVCYVHSNYSFLSMLLDLIREQLCIHESLFVCMRMLMVLTRWHAMYMEWYMEASADIKHMVP